MSVTTNISVFYSNVEIGANITVDTDTFYLDAGNGRVGINTNSPNTSLHVVGDSTFTYTGTSYSTVLLNGDRTISLTASSNANNGKIKDVQNNKLRINEKLYLNGSGNVGLGASSSYNLGIYPGSQVTTHLGKLKMTTASDHCRFSIDDKDTTASYSLKIETASPGNVTFNVPTGRQFNMLRGTNYNLWYDGSTDRLGIGTNDVGHTFQVDGHGIALRRPAKVQTFSKTSTTIMNNNNWVSYADFTFTPLDTGGRNSEIMAYFSIYLYMPGSSTDKGQIRMLVGGTTVSFFERYFLPEAGGGGRRNGNFLLGGKTVSDTTDITISIQGNTSETDDAMYFYNTRGYVIQYTTS